MKHILKANTYITPADDCALCSIREHAMCRAVPEADLPKLLEYRHQHCSVGAKKYLYQQGMQHQLLYTLYSGWVMQYKTLHNGKRQILRYALPGDFLTFQSDQQGPMQHSALTLTDCSLCAFPREQFLSMLEQMPHLSIQLAMFAARDYEYQISIGHKNAQERLAFLFFDLFLRIKRYDPATVDTVELPITQEDIGDTLGLTQVHVNRTLRQLRESGVLEFVHHKLIIRDFNAIQHLAGHQGDILDTQNYLKESRI